MKKAYRLTPYPHECIRGGEGLENFGKRTGDSFFIPCGAGEAFVSGECKIITVTTPQLKKGHGFCE